MSHRIAVFGGSFNPPGLHHRRVVEALLARFDEVVVVPCGPRDDKTSATSVDPVHRAALADKAFRGLDRDRVEVDLFDLEQASFTPTFELARRYAERGELWFAVGSDLITGGAAGATEIQKRWFRGQEIWQSLRWAVLTRPDHPIDPADLPPAVDCLEAAIAGNSSTIRERVFRHQPIDGLVAADVAAYIGRYRLYRGGLHARSAHLDLGEPRPFLVVDRRNRRARTLAERVAAAAGGTVPAAAASAIVVIGGDGLMLHAIREHWRERLPMVGVNAGHYGFLLNAPEHVLAQGELRSNYIVQHLPLVYVETVSPDGGRREALAFNDAWVERATPQTAWIEVKVDGDVRLERLICDGALISTAAGSTAYARAMGATPLRVDTPELLLVGSNTAVPFGWKSAHLSLESEIEFRCLDPGKRPLLGFADGISQGPVGTMRMRRSRIATVELAFSPDRDLTAKLTEIQFPRQGPPA